MRRPGVKFFKHYLHLPLVVLGALELAAFMSAPLLATVAFWPANDWRNQMPWAWPAVMYGVLHTAAMTATGLYHRRQRARFLGVLIRILVALAGGGAAVGLASYMFPTISVPRSVLLGSAIIAFFLVAGLRLAFEKLVDEDLFKRHVMVLGIGKRAMSVAQLRRRSDQRGFRVHGFLPVTGDRPLVPEDKIIAVEGSLLAYARQHEIDEIIVAMDDRRVAFPVRDLLECRLAGVEVIDLIDFLERETGRVRLDVLNPSWMIFAQGFTRNSTTVLLERAFDVVASLALLSVTWPLMLLAVIAIKLEDGPNAPVLYKQTRVGLDGKHFEVMKFRSMRTDAEKFGAVWATAHDPRITKVGNFCRKTRIDELPQILNVLRGDMAFVGPRPERPQFVEKLEQTIPYYTERHCVKPGITGWAQLCYPYGASEHDSAEKLQYDLYYVKNHNLLFDLMILLQTVEVVLWGKGR